MAPLLIRSLVGVGLLTVGLAVESGPAWVSRFNGSADFSDVPKAVAVDSAGNVFVTGRSRTVARQPNADEEEGAGELVTVKYDPIGNEVWVRRFPAAVQNEAGARAITLDKDGNVIVGGYSEATAGQGDTQFTTVKYSSTGAELWVRHYRGPRGTDSDIKAIGTDPLGNIYVTGDSNAFYPNVGEAQDDFATIKYAPDGTELWVKRYDGPAHGEDEAKSLRVDASGNSYVCGISPGLGTGDDIAIVKYDSNGNELWVRRYTSPGARGDDPGEVQVDGNGNVYVVGSTPGLGGSDIVLLKYDPAGTPLWVQRYDSPAHDNDAAERLAVDRDGYAHVAGSSSGLLTLRYAPDGTLLWAKHYDGTGNGDFPAAVELDKAGGVYVVGESVGDDTGSDLVLIKYDANGNELWVRRYDGPGHASDVPAEGRALAVDGNLNVYVTGRSARGASEATEDFVTLKFAQPPADGSGYELVHDFDFPEGTSPGGLFRASDGTLYGTAASGGPDDLGTIFRLRKDGRFETLFVFREDDALGAHPSPGPLAELNGALYGTTSGDGVTLPGSIFKITPGGDLAMLHNFAISGIEGRNPNGGLTLGTDGNFYGTTREGGANGAGTFFRITPDEKFVKLLDFDTAKGTKLAGSLLLLDDGSFLGTAQEGGANGVGTIFRVTAEGAFTLLHHFAIPSGSGPESGITRGANGRYYGVAAFGGALGDQDGGGVFYEITLAGAYTAIRHFDPATGITPGAGLTLGSDGAFYGSGRRGGSDDLGMIFRLLPTGEFTVLHTFSRDGGELGFSSSRLVEGTDRRLYGASEFGGSSDFGGFLFRLPIPAAASATPADRGLRASMPVGAPPTFDGTLIVNLISTGNAGQWRLAGELAWRDSGTQLTGLAPGDYLVEFRPVEGRAPDPELIHVDAAGATPSFTYPATTPVLNGGVSVIIKPDYIATAKDELLRGQWRRLGEVAYHNSGETVTLPAGVHLIEFKGVAGRRTPLKASVLVGANAISEFTATYFPQPTLNGALPAELSISAATTNEPYVFCGQILSDAGTASGFAVADRVVLTAAHVVFDESSLAFNGGLRWLFQRMRGEVEPVPLVPRGAYLLDGYAAARQKPGVVPGESTVESQQADVGALYFDTSAARGGFSGYLVSNPADEWVGLAGQKTIVGYPTEIVPEAARGRMFATPVLPVNFTRVLAPAGLASQVWKTQDIAGLPGISGGPLFVQFDGGAFYPAGVFLGGNGEALVRAIDAQVETMILNAAISASTGQHNNNGGSTQVSARVSAAAFTLTSLTLNLSPSAGTAWRLVDPRTATTGAFQTSGTPRTGLALGTYAVEFADRAGFLTPPKQIVTLDSADPKIVAVNYTPLPLAVITSPATALLSPNFIFNFSLTATNQPTSFTLEGSLPPGLNFSGNAITGTVDGNAPLGTFPVTSRVTNAAGLGPPFTLTLRVVAAGTLNVATNNAAGGSVVPAINGPKIVPQGTVVRLTARPNAAFLFAGWTGTQTTASPRLIFRMPAFATVTANFAANPFFEINGNYTGLLGSIPAEFAKAGLLSLDLGRTGAFTATLQLGSGLHRFRGAFSLAGEFQGSISRGRTLSALPIVLHLAPDPAGARRIIGTVTLDGVPLDLALDRASYSRAAPAPQAGRYTLVFPRDPNRLGSEIPQGNGFGTVIVTGNGAVRFNGQLGDGTVFGQSGRLNRGNHWPFHTRLYKLRGGVSGDLTFPATPSDDDVTGELAWFSPANRRARFYPAGFTTELAARGSRFTPTPLVDFAAATVSIGAGGLNDVPPPFDLRFTARGKAIPPAGLFFPLRFIRGTALFTGQFRHPVTHRPVPFSGALLQKQQTGHGLFRGAGKQTGFVEFTATP
jgi:uncharacterized repeat protein (TIGR03803 family)